MALLSGIRARFGGRIFRKVMISLVIKFLTYCFNPPGSSDRSINYRFVFLTHQVDWDRPIYIYWPGQFQEHSHQR